MKNWIFYIPRAVLSRIVGFLCEIRFMAPLSTLILRLFVKFAGIDMIESDKPLKKMQSIQDVFTRKLREGARPVGEGVCAPADGQLTLAEAVGAGQATQVKGLTYSLNELCFAAENRLHAPSKAEFFWQFTVYLAPHNYHRVHSPVTGKLQRVRYIPGERWPVNQKFVSLVPGLFVKNERAVFEIEMSPHLKAYVVMVAALNVGKIQSRFWPTMEIEAKACSLAGTTTSKLLGVEVKTGDELGVFALGSTVVTVFERSEPDVNLTWQEFQQPYPVRMGESISA